MMPKDDITHILRYRAQAPPETVDLAPTEQLPAVIPPPPRNRGEWRRLKRGLLLLLPLAAGMGASYWWLHPRAGLPPGIASGNGRLEADEIDIDTKFPGRVARLLADEGDVVKAGQVVALMDTQDLAASLEKAAALALQAQRTLVEAQANLEQQNTRVRFAQQELDRARFLVPKGFQTQEVLGQREQQMTAAVAANSAAIATVNAAEFVLDAAIHDVQLDQINIADNSLVTPRDGRIQYRVANPGEVLAAGGRVFTILDTGYVYMDIYLPTVDADRIRLGAEARVVLDADPTRVVPAVVTFIASQAQFTPKDVETKDERDKLMFRIRVRIDPERLRTRAEAVRGGLPGVAYVRTDPSVAWPPRLQVDAAK